MGAITTLVVTVAAAAGAVAAYRFVDNKRRELREIFSGNEPGPSSKSGAKIIDYERDPDSGVFKPKD